MIKMTFTEEQICNTCYAVNCTKEQAVTILEELERQKDYSRLEERERVKNIIDNWCLEHYPLYSESERPLFITKLKCRIDERTEQ